MAVQRAPDKLSPSRPLNSETLTGTYPGLRFGFLESQYLEQVCALEVCCYPAPWSRVLIESEFSKVEISFRAGLFCGDEVLAYCFSHLVSGDLHILNLAVAPKHQGLGLGSVLLYNLLSSATGAGAEQAYLEVRLSNEAAKRLYAKHGFRVVGTRKAYYRNNGEDALLMELRDLSKHLEGFKKITAGRLLRVASASAR